MKVTREARRAVGRIDLLARKTALRINCDRIRSQGSIDKSLQPIEHHRALLVRAESAIVANVNVLAAKLNRVVSPGKTRRLKELIEILRATERAAAEWQRSNLGREAEDGNGRIRCQRPYVELSVVHDARFGDHSARPDVRQ